MYERTVAGAFVGVASVLLIWQNHINEAMYLLLPTLGFFIGEKNGERKTNKEGS